MANPKLAHPLELLYVLNASNEPNSVMLNYDKSGSLIEILNLPKSSASPFSLNQDSNKPILSYDPSLGQYYAVLYRGNKLYRHFLDAQGNLEKHGYEKYNPPTQKWVAEKSEDISKLFEKVDNFNNKKEILQGNIIANKYYTRLSYLKNARSPLSWLGDVIGYKGFSNKELIRRKQADIEFWTENFGYEGFDEEYKKRKKLDKDFQPENSPYFNALAKTINEKVDLFDQGRKDGKFTAYDIETLHVLAAAIELREKEYRVLSQHKISLEGLKKYGEQEEKKAQGSLIFNIHDINFANQYIGNELDVVNKILDKHNDEYQKLLDSKKKVADWLETISEQNYKPIRGQVFSIKVDFVQSSKVGFKPEENNLTPELKSFIAQHGLALTNLLREYKKFPPGKDTSQNNVENFTEQDIQKLSNSNNTLDLADFQGNYAGTLSSTGWSYDMTKQSQNPLVQLWIEKALVSAYLNNDKGEIYLSGGWVDDQDKRLIAAVYRIAAASFGTDKVFTGPTSITTFERKEMDKVFKENGYLLTADWEKKSVDSIQRLLGLKQDKNKVIRVAENLGLNKAEAERVFESVKDKLHPENAKTKKDFFRIK